MFRSFFLTRRWALWAYAGLVLILMFVYAQTTLNVAINTWYRDFYNVLQHPKIGEENQTALELNASQIEAAAKKADQDLEKANLINKLPNYIYQSILEHYVGTRSLVTRPAYDMGLYFTLLVVFLWLAVPYVIISTLNIYFTSIYTFKWREAMTFSYFSYWKKKDDNIEGSSQRIQEDAQSFATITESLGLQFVRALMTLFAFIPILWGLSKPVSDALFKNLADDSALAFLKDMDGLLVYVALFISIGGLIISWFVGIKLPGLEYNNQKAEAAFRKELVYAEDDRQKYAHERTFVDLFTGLRVNYYKLFAHYGYFNIWLYLFNQLIIIFPFVVLGPALFFGAITVGIVIQVNNAFDQVRHAFSVLIDNWKTIVKLRSIYKRLNEFEKHIDYKG